MKTNKPSKIENLSKLTTRVKQVWINALTSRKFKQGEGELKEGGDNGEDVKYCCLGVLGECLPRFNQGNDGNYLSYTLLPKKVQDMLAALNDGEDTAKATFGQIAQIIALPNKQLLRLADLYQASLPIDVTAFEHELRKVLREAKKND